MRDPLNIPAKVRINNNHEKYPLVIVIRRTLFPCLSYGTVLTKGDYVEVLI